MIIFVKTFTKNFFVNGICINSSLGVNIVGHYENERLIPLDEEEKRTTFLNQGKVFVPSHSIIPENHTYRLYEVIESHSYDSDKETSCKYFLHNEVTDVPLFEVLDIDETVNTEKDKIIHKLINGMNLEFVPLQNIFFRTADDFIIGPVQLQLLGNNLWSITEENFVTIRSNQLELIQIENNYERTERLFAVHELIDEDILDYLDVGSNDRVVRDVLKMLKDNIDFGELSRKITSKLVDWYSKGYPSEKQQRERLKRAIEIMELHTLDEVTVLEVEKGLMHLETVKEIIERKVTDRFNDEYTRFEQLNRQLLQQVKQKKSEIERLTIQYNVKKEANISLEKTLEDFKKEAEHKINAIQQNVTTTYVDQLLMRGLPVIQQTEPTVVQSQTNQLVHPTNLNAPFFENLQSSLDLLRENLRLFKGRDSNHFFAQTILAAIAQDEPLVLVGEHAYDLAQVIARTFAANETISVLPEVQAFSLAELESHYSFYNDKDMVKVLHIHDAHTSAAEFSIPSYIKMKKWSANEKTPNLFLLTIHDPKEASDFLQKIQYLPIIDADKFIKRNIVKNTFKQIVPGQLSLSLIDEINTDVGKELAEKLEYWLIQEKDLEIELSGQLGEWLGYVAYVDCEDDDKLFEWLFILFEQYFQTLQTKVMSTYE